MKFKTNAIIALVFSGLLAFVYWYEIKGGKNDRWPRKRPGWFWISGLTRR